MQKMIQFNLASNFTLIIYLIINGLILNSNSIELLRNNIETNGILIFNPTLIDNSLNGSHRNSLVYIYICRVLLHTVYNINTIYLLYTSVVVKLINWHVLSVGQSVKSVVFHEPLPRQVL